MIWLNCSWFQILQCETQPCHRQRTRQRTCNQTGHIIPEEFERKGSYANALHTIWETRQDRCLLAVGTLWWNGEQVIWLFLPSTLGSKHTHTHLYSIMTPLACFHVTTCWFSRNVYDICIFGSGRGRTLSNFWGHSQILPSDNLFTAITHNSYTRHT